MMKTDNELEPIKDDDELDLENTIRQLMERKDAARDGSAEHRMVIRQLDGLRGTSLLAEQIMEEYNWWRANALLTAQI
jgi:hypothetical protein